MAVRIYIKVCAVKMLILFDSFCVLFKQNITMVLYSWIERFGILKYIRQDNHLTKAARTQVHLLTI